MTSCALLGVTGNSGVYKSTRSSMSGFSAEGNGSTMRWQTWQVTPSKSPKPLLSALPSGGVLRPSSQAPGAWQRRQYSPEPAASWLAIASAAWKIGSRADCAFMEAAQRS